MASVVSMKQKLVVLATCFVMTVGLLLLLPWWLALLGIIAMTPFVLAVIFK